MQSKVILITGSTDGIGKVAAIRLAKQGHTVIVHGRNRNKTISFDPIIDGEFSQEPRSTNHQRFLVGTRDER